MRFTVALCCALPLALLTRAAAEPLNLLSAVRTAELSRGTVRAAELRLREAEFNYRAATGLSALRLEAGYGTTPTLGAGEDFLIALPLDVAGKNRAVRGAAGSAVRTARAVLRQAKLDLQTDVINAYADLLAAQIRYRTGQQMLELQQRSNDATRKRVEAGDLPPVELLRAGLDLERARAASIVNEQTLRASRLRLGAATGVEITEDVQERVANFPGGHPGLRPDVQQLQSAVDSTQWEIRTATASRLPDFELQFRRSPFGTPEQYNFRGQLVWNLLDWGAGVNRTRAARTARLAAQRDLQDRVSFASRDAGAAQAEASAAQASVDSFAKLEADALSLVQKEQRGYELGGNTLLGVLEATRALREIEASAAEAAQRLLQAEARLLAAQGIILTESK